MDGLNRKINTSCENPNHGKTTCSERGKDDDNMSDKGNSVQTSYKNRKPKYAQDTVSSNESYRNYNTQGDDDSVSYEISEDDNLICPNCINCTLMEEKQRREELEKQREREMDRNFDYGGGFPEALYDKNRNREKELIDERRRQREHNTNEAIQNLAKINAGLSNKDKLIQQYENSRNPLNEGYPDYQYQRFQDEYQRRQKMINDNIDKYYPNAANERADVKSYYDKYVYNPNYNDDRRDEYNNINNKIGEYDQRPNDTNKRQYYKDLEDQINYKNELKKREKEEERRRGQRQFDDIQKELKREEEEKYLKDKRQQEELIRANNELINQKNKMKIKELEDKLKYRELYDRQNEEYQKDLERQKLEKERMKRDMYIQNENERRRREMEREKEKEREREEKEKERERDERQREREERERGRGREGEEREREKEGYGGKYGEKYDEKYDRRYPGKSGEKYDI